MPNIPVKRQLKAVVSGRSICLDIAGSVCYNIGGVCPVSDPIYDIFFKLLPLMLLPGASSANRYHPQIYQTLSFLLSFLDTAQPFVQSVADHKTHNSNIRQQTPAGILNIAFKTLRDIFINYAGRFGAIFRMLFLHAILHTALQFITFRIMQCIFKSL